MLSHFQNFELKIFSKKQANKIAIMSETVEQILEEFIPVEKLADVKRVLYGRASV